jgi:flagellar hook-length control protein FliK
MNTSLPLLNVITGSQAATGSRSGNPADSFSADVPFNQVLNSQVNTRVQDNQAQARQAQQNAENQAAAKPQQPASPPPPNNPRVPPPTPAPPARVLPAMAATRAARSATRTRARDSTDTTTQASAELLALVANIAQNAVTPADGKAKGESSEADLLAQAKRGGKMSLADQQQALADEKQGKVDPAALQDALATARSKQDAAASELASKRNAEANPARSPPRQGWKSGD